MLKSKNLVPRNRLLVADAFIIFIFLILLIRFGQIQLFEYKQYKKELILIVLERFLFQLQEE